MRARGAPPGEPAQWHFLYCPSTVLVWPATLTDFWGLAEGPSTGLGGDAAGSAMRKDSVCQARSSGKWYDVANRSRVGALKWMLLQALQQSEVNVYHRCRAMQVLDIPWEQNSQCWREKGRKGVRPCRDFLLLFGSMIRVLTLFMPGTLGYERQLLCDYVAVVETTDKTLERDSKFGPDGAALVHVRRFPLLEEPGGCFTYPPAASALSGPAVGTPIYDDGTTERARCFTIPCYCRDGHRN
ncbi:hypothetical protein DENSPDRAFT_312230 [Dentipellis sp. KUC8613]|nr:hypothetical protein DENSPDRAFT_312230 [Dentipellis sp. KUC8613]